MKKLSVATVAALTTALITAAPFSLNWSPANTPFLSFGTAQAGVGLGQ